MHIEQIEIRRFRNLEMIRAEFDPGLNVICGKNAQGKTNLLEAVHYLATGRSFRTSREDECLPFGAEAGAAAWMRARIARGPARHEIEAAIARQEREIRVDGKTVRRLTDFWGLFLVVLFTPDDLQTVGGGPAGRRQWLDMALSQASRPYLDALKRFTRALRQRNTLLRRPPPRPPGLAEQARAYEGPLAESAGRIYVEREKFVRDIAPFAARRHAQFCGADEALAIEYSSFLDSAQHERNGKTALDEGAAAELYARLLAERRDDDLARGQTLNGPHRDDLVFSLNGREARAFSSQGQARSIALSLRMAEVDYLREATGHAPVLLLDDILSELDPDRLAALLSSLAQAEIQTILTTTDLAPLRNQMERARIWKMSEGRLA